MDELKLQYQAQQYWFDGSDRENYFIGKAVAHAAALADRCRGTVRTVEEIRTALAAGEIVSTGPDWDARIRSRAALERHAATKLQRQIEQVRCDCGHTVPTGTVMNASRGSACPDCYDQMSD